VRKAREAAPKAQRAKLFLRFSENETEERKSECTTPTLPVFFKCTLVIYLYCPAIDSDTSPL
jgi:hypothetical protein